MEIIKPQKLKTGDVVGIVSPSGFISFAITNTQFDQYNFKKMIKKIEIFIFRFFGLISKFVGWAVFILSLFGWLSGEINYGIPMIMGAALIWSGDLIGRKNIIGAPNKKPLFSVGFKIVVMIILSAVVLFIGLTKGGYIPNYFEISALEPVQIFKWENCPDGMICI